MHGIQRGLDPLVPREGGARPRLPMAELAAEA